MVEIIAEVVLTAKEEYSYDDIIINIDNQCANFTINTFKDGLIQAMVNILTNAKEAFIDKNITNAKITIVCKEDSKSIYIKISDNAGGINEETLPKVFTPFFSTKTDKHGVGLGLYMTKTIVEEVLDGVLSVRNFNDGAEFTIELPK